MMQLPTVIVHESLDRFPLGTAESNGWKSKIDQTGYLNVVRDPQDLLDLRFSTGRGGPVNGQAGRETQPMGCQHKVLNCRIDTRIPDLLTLSNTVQVDAAIDYDRYFLGVLKHLRSLIINIPHPRRHSRSTSKPLEPCSEHRSFETGFHLRVTDNNKFPRLSIAARGSLRRALEDDFQFVLRDLIRIEFAH